MNKTLVKGLIIGALIVAVVGYFLISSGTLSSLGLNGSRSVGITGTFNINGVIPEGSTISISERAYNSSNEPVVLVKGITIVDGASWSLNSLKEGMTYQVIAQVSSQDGTSLVSSDPLVVTAPATEEQLTINIPDDKSNATAIISGNITVNGYIPTGSTIAIEGKLVGGSTFTTVASGLPGQKKQFMSYATAVAGKSYEVRGMLYDGNGNQIGTSDPLDITAPAANEVLTINSSAAAPTQSPSQNPTPVPAANKTLSGTINFNGVAPSSSRIVILQKAYNSANYQVAVDNVTPVDGVAWQWTGAQASVWYDVIAVLKQRQSDGSDKDIASSAKQSIAAPASGIQFSINSGVSISAPTGQVSITCQNRSGDQWNVQITLPTVTGAKSYWYQVGSTNGASDKANKTQNSSGSNNVQINTSLSMNSGQTYYFRYAYANVANLGTGNSQYSPFSSTAQGTCQ